MPGIRNGLEGFSRDRVGSGVRRSVRHDDAIRSADERIRRCVRRHRKTRADLKDALGDRRDRRVSEDIGIRAVRILALDPRRDAERPGDRRDVGANAEELPIVPLVCGGYGCRSGRARKERPEPVTTVE